LGDLCVHRLLIGGHGIDPAGQQVDRLTKSLVGLCLGYYEVLHEALQVGRGFKRRRRWIV